MSAGEGERTSTFPPIDLVRPFEPHSLGKASCSVPPEPAAPRPGSAPWPPLGRSSRPASHQKARFAGLLFTNTGARGGRAARVCCLGHCGSELHVRAHAAGRVCRRAVSPSSPARRVPHDVCSCQGPGSACLGPASPSEVRASLASPRAVVPRQEGNAHCQTGRQGIRIHGAPESGGHRAQLQQGRRGRQHGPQ